MILKGNIVHHGMWLYLDVDLVIVLTAYLVVHYTDVGAGFFAVGLGMLMDVFSAGPLGFCTLIYLVVFLGIKAGSFLFDLLSPRGEIALITLSVLFKSIVFFLLLRVFSFEVSLSFSNMMPSVSSALCTGLLSPAVFRLLDFFSKVCISGGGTAEDRP